MSSSSHPGLSLTFLVSALTTGHTAGTMAMFVLPAVAPAVADDYSLDPSLIGYQISLFGGILAALVGPAVAVAAGWRWSVVASAALLYAVIALMQRDRREWDDDREPSAPAVAGNPFAGVTTIWAEGSLRLVSIAGICFSWAQFCVVSYVVVACVQTLGMSLVVAGTVLTVVQATSAVSRVFVGWLVDRAQNTARVLAWVAGILLFGCLAALGMSPALPLLAVYLLFAVLGGTTGSWPGTVLAEVGRLAPQGQVSLATSGALVIINIGKFVGPALFAIVYAVSSDCGHRFLPTSGEVHESGDTDKGAYRDIEQADHSECRPCDSCPGSVALDTRTHQQKDDRHQNRRRENKPIPFWNGFASRDAVYSDCGSDQDGE